MSDLVHLGGREDTEQRYSLAYAILEMPTCEKGAQSVPTRVRAREASVSTRPCNNLILR